MGYELLIYNIKSLLQVDQKPVKGIAMATCPLLDDAWLLIKEDRIDSFGTGQHPQSTHVIDAGNGYVLPSFCDSHSHIVYAGSREAEFNDRLHGMTYQEIAARGGGILNSAARLRNASEEELIRSALLRINEVMDTGTAAIEIKSGYGLTTESELKMLRVIKKLKNHTPVTIRSTFLGAHAVPDEYRNDRKKYIQLIIDEMLPAVAEEKLADYCDVFCEQNYFSEEETVNILSAALQFGLKPKVHANQLGYTGGISAGVKTNAVSVDHLEYTSEEDIQLLAASEVTATLLPGAQFFLQLPSPPARKLINAGIRVAIASDYNPGSCPSGNMPQMMSMASIIYKMTPEETLNATTINGAQAMGVDDIMGSIAAGKKANFIITRPMPSLAYWNYSFGSNLISKLIINGKVVRE